MDTKEQTGAVTRSGPILDLEMPQTPMVPGLLLVEDNPDDEALSLRAIARSGVLCRVTVCRDGAEALDFMLGVSESPGLIILDYNIPKLNGLEVLTQLRGLERTRHTPVVIFSGTNMGTELTQCYCAGANSCVSKSRDSDEYLDSISWIAHYWLSVNRASVDGAWSA